MSQTFQQQPPNTTILTTNVPEEGQTWIYLPQTGTLWVAYEGGPAQLVFIWHQGGTTEIVYSGFSTFNVSETDALVYQLGDPSIAIKLGWAYI
jgi:hypothetical protein